MDLGKWFREALMQEDHRRRKEEQVEEQVGQKGVSAPLGKCLTAATAVHLSGVVGGVGPLLAPDLSAGFDMSPCLDLHAG